MRPPSTSATDGVPHRSANPLRFAPLECLVEEARGVGERVVSVADCKREESLAAVWRADLRRREQARRNSVAQADQVSSDFGKSEAQMMRDVFEKDEGRHAFVHDAGDVRPQMPRVVCSAPATGKRERLARIPRMDDVHAATPASAVEGRDIVPHRRPTQGRVFHPRHDDGRSIGFPLDVTNSAIGGQGDVETEIEAHRAGAQGEPEQRSFIAAEIASGGTYSQAMQGSRSLGRDLGEAAMFACEHRFAP